ncbi:hypothetical protein I3760_11G191800 [Carya illinoinensis]|uniref:uncharacterized protein LOC122281278 n=1 Tax=Carya illinoinensis TaxID=32201 RepID=UPI001BFAAD5D|nr:uncharacterized protein LOC122281278 [Carya illinoinensis]KAG2682446.1 hypothetical protein I3760_11G191800 [Carya illinoinensis]
MIGCDNLSSNLSTNLLQYPSTQSAAPRLFCLPGSEVPNWFGHQRIGSSISFRVPSLSEGEIRMLLFCTVCTFQNILDLAQLDVIIQNKTRGYRHVLVPIRFDASFNISQNLFLFQSHVIRNKLKTVDFPEKEMEMVSGEEIEVSFNNSSSANFEVSKCGVHLLLEKPNVMDNKGSMVQYLKCDNAKDDEMSAAADDNEISFPSEVVD